MTHVRYQARDGPNRMPEPSGARARLIDMNPRRWAAVAAVAVLLLLLAVFVSVSLLSKDSPATGPSAPGARQPFAFDAAYADANPRVLVVRYGDSSSCPSEAVRYDVVEQPDRIVVTLTRAPQTNQPCTADYRAMLVRAALSGPLGSREVVDGSRKAPVAISTGQPPLG